MSEALLIEADFVNDTGPGIRLRPDSALIHTGLFRGIYANREVRFACHADALMADQAQVEMQSWKQLIERFNPGCKVVMEVISMMPSDISGERD